jgi:O-antigen/teichoic acid export membrane protein
MNFNGKLRGLMMKERLPRYKAAKHDEEEWRTRISESTTVRLPDEKDVIAQSLTSRLSAKDAIAESRTVRLPRGKDMSAPEEMAHSASSKDGVVESRTICLPDKKEVIANGRGDQSTAGTDGEESGRDESGDEKGHNEDETLRLPLITFSSYTQDQAVHPFDMGMMKTPLAFDTYSFFEEKPSLFDGYHEPHASEFDTIPMMVLKDISIRQGDEAPVMRSEVSGAAGGAAIVGIGNIAGSILKFGSNYLLQVGFGATMYGLYSIGLAMAQLLASLCTLGFDNASIRYSAIYQSERRMRPMRGLLMFTTIAVAVISIIGALLLVLGAPLIAAIKHSPDLSPLLQLIAPMVPLLSLQAVWFGGLQGLKQFKWRVMAERIVMPAVLLVLAVTLFFFYHNVLNITLATVVSTLAGTVVGAYFLYRVLGHRIKGERAQYDVREWMNFAVFNFLTSITEVVLESIDTLLLVALAVTNLEIGQYNAAVKISDFIAMPLFSLNTMFAPTIAELHSQGEQQKLSTMYKVVNKWIITLSLPIFWVATLFSHTLLQLSGRSFSDAWPLLVVSAVGSMVNAGMGSVGYMLLMTGHQKISFFNSVFSVVMNIVIGALLIPHFGAMGTALGTAITLIIANIMRFCQIRVLLKMYPYSWDIWKPIVASLLGAAPVAGLLFLLRESGLVIHLLLVPIFMLSYLLCIILFKVSAEDMIVLEAFKKKFLRR